MQLNTDLKNAIRPPPDGCYDFLTPALDLLFLVHENGKTFDSFGHFWALLKRICHFYESKVTVSVKKEAQKTWRPLSGIVFLLPSNTSDGAWLS